MSVSKIVICIIAAMVQAISTTISLSRQLSYDKSLDKIDKIKILISIFLYCIVVFFFIPNELRFIFFIVVLSMILYFIVKIKESIVILHSFITEIFLIISEIIGTSTLVLIGLDSVSIVEDPLYNLLANILISLILIFISYLPIFKLITKSIITLYNKRRKIINYFAIFALLFYIILSKNGLELVLKSNYYINIVFIIGVMIMIIIMLKSESKAEELKIKHQQMLNYVTKYEKIITEQGKANHEFKNQLMVIRGYAQMNSPKLIEYLDSITEDISKTHSSYLISQLNKFPDGGIKGLLYYKLSTMDDEKIKYEINVESGVKTKLKSLDTLSFKNITKILGILLDNAIDASKKSIEKKIEISTYKEKTKIVFKISNTFGGKLNLEKIGTGYTTKGKGHGYGLRIVQDIIEKDNKYKLVNMVNDNFYTVILNITLKK